MTLNCSCSIHFAGTESATVWCGFMNGAVQAGNRVALEILYDLRPQLVTVSDIQSVQGPRRQKLGTKSKRVSSASVLKISLGLGIVVAAVIGVRRYLNGASTS